MALVLCNLKARKLGGVSSNGMLLCASNAAHDKVETLAAPSTCEPGERCFFGDGNSQAQPDALSPNQVMLQSALSTLCEATALTQQDLAGREEEGLGAAAARPAHQPRQAGHVQGQGHAHAARPRHCTHAVRCPHLMSIWGTSVPCRGRQQGFTA